MVVPKRLLSRAVDRNRVKRIVRERFRLAQGQIAGHDWLVRLTRAPLSRDDVPRDVDSLFCVPDAN